MNWNLTLSLAYIFHSALKMAFYLAIFGGLLSLFYSHSVPDIVQAHTITSQAIKC